MTLQIKPIASHILGKFSNPSTDELWLVVSSSPSFLGDLFLLYYTRFPGNYWYFRLSFSQFFLRLENNSDPLDSQYIWVIHCVSFTNGSSDTQLLSIVRGKNVQQLIQAEKWTFLQSQRLWCRPISQTNKIHFQVPNLYYMSILIPSKWGSI